VIESRYAQVATQLKRVVLVSPSEEID